MRQSKLIGYSKPLNKIANPRAGLDSIYLYGSNNLYPYYVKNAILGSPTASLAHRAHKNNIAKGVNIKDFVINKRKDILLSSLNDSASVDTSMFGGFYIHLNYEWDISKEKFIPVNPTILPFEDCRINKEDDAGNFSKVFVDNFLDAKRGMFKPDKVDWYYKYNPDNSVILKQIKKDADKKGLDLSTDEGKKEALRGFRGQVRFCNSTSEFPYPTSIADSVLGDCLSEYFISRYTYGQTVNGFMGKVVAFLKEGDSEENKEFEDDLVDWLSTDGANGIYVQTIQNVDDIDKVLVIKNFESNFNDELFKETTERLRDNILGAFDNLPKILVYSGDGALFGTNPETWKNAEQYFYKNTEYLRDWKNRMLSDTLNLNLDETNV